MKAIHIEYQRRLKNLMYKELNRKIENREKVFWSGMENDIHHYIAKQGYPIRHYHYIAVPRNYWCRFLTLQDLLKRVSVYIGFNRSLCWIFPGLNFNTSKLAETVWERVFNVFLFVLAFPLIFYMIKEDNSRIPNLSMPQDYVVENSFQPNLITHNAVFKLNALTKAYV